MIHSSSTNESCSNSGIFFWFTIIFLNQSIVFLHAISSLENEAGTNQGHALRYYHQQKKKKKREKNKSLKMDPRISPEVYLH